MVTPVVGMLVILVVFAANGPGHCASYDQYDNEDYEDGCHPEEADVCFNAVNDNLMCNLGKTGPGRNCTGRDADDLCQSMDDALQCCEDIMYTCSVGEGLDTFEVWLTGLKGVYHHLCVEDEELDLITDLLRGSNCFRLKRFMNCVEERANLTHVANLLTTQLDLHECNRLQISVAACIEDSEKNRAKCRGKAQVVNEALIVFFSATGCGHAPPSPPTPSPVPCLVAPTTSGPGQEENGSTAQHNSNNNSNPTGNENSNNNSKNNTSNSVTNSIDSIITSTPSTTTTTTTTTTTITISSPSSNSNSSSDSSSNATNSSSSKWENNTVPNKTIPNSSSSSAESLTCHPKKDLANSGTPTASTVVVTVLVTLVVVMLLGMVLLKRGVITIRTDLDRRLMGLNDDETNSAYDRF